MIKFNLQEMSQDDLQAVIVRCIDIISHIKAFLDEQDLYFESAHFGDILQDTDYTFVKSNFSKDEFTEVVEPLTNAMKTAVNFCEYKGFYCFKDEIKDMVKKELSQYG
jgi:hypothetical protein